MKLRHLLSALVLLTAPLFSQSVPYAPRAGAPGNLLFKDSEYQIRERFRWLYQERARPLGYIPEGAREAAWRQSQAMPTYHPKAALTKSAGTVARWTNVGPSNVGGRITGIAIHPTNPNIVLFTAADGGVWKSTNGGTAFTPIADDMPTMAMGAIEIDPTNPDIIYVGTGEANGSADSFGGVGVMKSTDGGAHWFLSGNNVGSAIAKLRVSKFNHNLVIVTSRSGIFRTTNAGGAWTKTRDGIAFDVVFHPTDPAMVYAAVQGVGVVRSVDTGQTWTTLNIGVAADSIGRLAIDLCQAQPNVIYAVIVSGKGTSNLKAIVKTTNGGASWFRTNSTTTPNFFSSYGWYLCEIAVHPTNPNRILSGGVPLYMSTDGGYTWSARAGPHVDHHAMEFSFTNPNIFYLGNDGGFYRSVDSGAMYTDCNTNLPITQFYELGIAPQYADMMGGGTQDNGSKLRIVNTDVWSYATGSDGGYFVIDYSNSNYMYAESQNGGIMRTTNAGKNWSGATTGISGSGLWVTPISIHPTNPTILFTATTKKMYKTTNRGASWFAFHGNQDSASSINYIAISPKNPDVMLTGYTNGRIWKTTNAGASWAMMSTGIPSSTCKEIIFDPIMPETYYACFSGYSSSSVFKTTNGGSNWFSISGNLPGTPKNSIEISPTDTSNLFVGTDLGVYATTNSGKTWSILGDGMPKVVVVDLELNPSTGVLYAATHGRSVYRLDAVMPVELTSFSGRLDGNTVRLDWRTVNEHDNRGFAIQRLQMPGSDWTDIGFVDGSGTSASVSLYSFNDTQLPIGAETLLYRLKQVDFNGSYEYSNEVMIRIAQHAPGSFALEQNYPNPFNTLTTIRYMLPTQDHVEIVVTDAVGRIVTTPVSRVEPAGMHFVTLDASALPEGAYFCQLRQGMQRQIRKMLVMR
jgi:photosystem II stability/assembly factor-like uncharacterized protein